MMFVGKPSPSTSPIPPHSLSPLVQSDTDAADDEQPTPSSPSPLLCWATQSLCDLARGETELRRLWERQVAETESVSRGLERAILGARREEQRLLERVEQDHRDAQRLLEQLQRENTAAARVSQSLLDQRLRKLSQLRDQIHKSFQGQNGSEQNLLLRGVTKLLQPWEICLSLKKVSFKPSSQTKSVMFGDIRVQEHDLCFNVGGCGAQGQMCALHYGKQCGDTQDGVAGEERSSPDGGTGPRQAKTSVTGTGNLRVVRKIRLSGQNDKESGEEKSSFSNTKHWPPDRGLSQDEDQDFAITKPHGEDLFLAVPALLKHGGSEDLRHKTNNVDGQRFYGVRNQRNQNTLVSVSKRESSSPSEGGRLEHSSLSLCWSMDSQDGGDSRGRVTPCRSPGGQSSPTHSYGCETLSSSSRSPREPLTSYSLMDLTSRDRPDDRPTGNREDPGRAPSPADSLDSCYTFIVSSPSDRSRGGSIKQAPRLSKSVADLSGKTRPLINGRRRDHVRDMRMNRTYSTNSIPPTLNHGHSVSEDLRAASRRKNSGVSLAKKQSERGGRTESREHFVLAVEDEGDLLKPQVGHLIRQFGKQGSGRSDLTLPSGVHATPQGQIFVVDCGNARVQVTDQLGNVIQQVNCKMSEGFLRRCQNYFDIAVNAKGLIALSCTAERALLVFSRHGRLLQTFGGSGIGSTKDELEAPRGITIHGLDEFLVADIRRGTLTALKLDPKTGSRLERTVVTGFHRPYLVDSCQSSGLVAVSERGSESGREPCVKVLEPGWNTIRVLGVCAGMGPILACPWGICIDRDGNVLVADWGSEHRVLLYPAQGIGRPIINQGLSGPRGIALMPDGNLVVSDSMHHCVKIYQYK